MGYLYVSSGKVESTLGGPPPEMVPAGPPWSEADRTGSWTQFWWSLRKGGGWSEPYVAGFVAVADAKGVADVQTALKQIGTSPADAQTLGNWLGGGVTAHLPAWLPLKEPSLTGPVLTESAYLNPQSLTAAGTGLNVAEALARLRGRSPLTHYWVVAKAKARALKQIPATVANLYQPLEKAVADTAAATAKAAQSAVSLVANTAQGLAAATDLVGWVARNVVPIALLGGGVYLATRWVRRRKAA